MEGGRMSHAKSAKAEKGAGGSAGGKNSRGAAEARRAWRTLLHKRTKRKQKGGWSAGRRPTLKSMKTASRTWKAGGKRMDSLGAGVPPAKRPKSGKQAKTPVFSVISHPAPHLEAAPPKSPRRSFGSFRATSGGAASCRAGGKCAADRPHRILSLFTFHLSLRPKGAAASCRAKADEGREGGGRRNATGMSRTPRSWMAWKGAPCPGAAP